MKGLGLILLYRSGLVEAGREYFSWVLVGLKFGEQPAQLTLKVLEILPVLSDSSII